MSLKSTVARGVVDFHSSLPRMLESYTAAAVGPAGTFGTWVQSIWPLRSVALRISSVAERRSVKSKPTEPK